MKDEEILRGFAARDEEALSACGGKYGAYCRAVAKNVLRDERDAEECVNDAMLSAWNSIPPQAPENLKIYLGKLTRDSAISRFRSRRAAKRIPEDMLTPFDEMEELVGRGSVEESVEAAELSAAISAFLRRLPETERNIFIRRYWYCDALTDMADRFGYGLSRVKMILKRTRDKLAEELRKEGYII